MSTTFAMPVTLTGPLPVPPPYALLSVAEVIEEGDAHWMSGGHVYGYPSDLPSGFDPCSTGTFRIKEEGTLPENPLFGAITLYLPVKCSSFSIGSPEEFSSRASAAFEARESFGIERQFSQGEFLLTNPFLADTNAIILAAGAPISPSQGMELLEEEIGKTGQMGVLHATPATVASWDRGGDLETGERIRTINGTPVASGGGYIGAKPSGQQGPTTNRAWAFATGPVEIRRSEVFLIPADIRAALDRSDNTVIYRAERNILATWDRQLQAAVLIDRTL